VQLQSARQFAEAEQWAYYLNIATSHPDWGMKRERPPVPSLQVQNCCSEEFNRAKYFGEHCAALPFYGIQSAWENMLTAKRNELVAYLGTFGRPINVFVAGLIGAGKSCFATEIASALLGRYVPCFTGRSSATHVTTEYTFVELRKLITVHCMEGLSPQDNIERHFSRTRRVLMGELKNGSHMDKEDVEEVRRAPIDIAYLIVGPQEHTARESTDLLIDLHSVVGENDDMPLIVVANKCDKTSEDDLVHDTITLQNCDPLRLIGSYDVAQRSRALCTALGVSGADVFNYVCPHAASVNQSCKTYFSLLILDNLLQAIRLRQQR